MAKKKSVFGNMFSTEDPINQYRGKQDAFIDSMDAISNGRQAKGFSTSTRQANSCNNDNHCATKKRR